MTKLCVAILFAFCSSGVLSHAQQDTAKSVVNVSGDVNRPGSYPHADGMTVRALLVSAGGVVGESLRDISIVRRSAGDAPATTKHPDDLARTITRLSATADTPIVAGDEVIVSAFKADFVIAGAQKMVEWISTGDFDSVTVAYTGVRPAQFEDRLRTQWRALQQRIGAFQTQVAVRMEPRGDAYAGVVTSQFAMGGADVVIVFNRDGTVRDISLVP